MRNSVRVLSASTLTGDDVTNPTGEDLGTLEDIMIDINSGRVAFAVVSFGGFLGSGDKLFAIPWGALSVDTEEHVLVLNVDRRTLENAPGFERGNWPLTTNGDEEWLVEIYDHYGYPPYWH